MPTIRKRWRKYQVQVRHRGLISTSRTFTTLKDTMTWAHQIETQVNRRDLRADLKVLQTITQHPYMNKKICEWAGAQRRVK